MIHTLLRKISSCCLVSRGNCFKSSQKGSLFRWKRFLLDMAQWRLLWRKLPFGWGCNTERAMSIHLSLLSMPLFRGQQFPVLEFAIFSEFQMLICETETIGNDWSDRSRWVATSKQWEKRVQTPQSTGVVISADYMPSYTSFIHYAETSQSPFTGHYQAVI